MNALQDQHWRRIANCKATTVCRVDGGRFITKGDDQRSYHRYQKTSEWETMMFKRKRQLWKPQPDAIHKRKTEDKQLLAMLEVPTPRTAFSLSKFAYSPALLSQTVFLVLLDFLTATDIITTNQKANPNPVSGAVYPTLFRSVQGCKPRVETQLSEHILRYRLHRLKHPNFLDKAASTNPPLSIVTLYT